MTKKQKEERFKDNPFLGNLEINYKSKQVKVSNLGKDDNIIVNQSTGEVHGTHVVTYKKVDDAEFIKLFAKNIQLTFELTAAGFKSLMVLVWVMQQAAINRDKVTLDSYTYEDFLTAHEEDEKIVSNFSIETYKRGLRELVSAKIIAKCVRRGDYFINPSFVFNGNRIAFTTALERAEGDSSRQMNLEMK